MGKNIVRERDYLIHAGKLCKALRDAKIPVDFRVNQIITQQKPVSGASAWISVNVQQPDEHESVIVWTQKHKNQYMAYREGGSYYLWGVMPRQPVPARVTHWTARPADGPETEESV